MLDRCGGDPVTERACRHLEDECAQRLPRVGLIREGLGQGVDRSVLGFELGLGFGVRVRAKVRAKLRLRVGGICLTLSMKRPW